jgi:hypothetical protein
MASRRNERCEELARHPLCHGGSARSPVMRTTPESVLPTRCWVTRTLCAEDLTRGLSDAAGGTLFSIRRGRVQAAVGPAACSLGSLEARAHARAHTPPVRAEAEKSACAALSMAFSLDYAKGLAFSGVYLP